MQRLSEIVWQEPDLVLDLIRYTNRPPLSIFEERHIDVSFVSKEESRSYLNKHIENEYGQKKVFNRDSLRKGNMFVNKGELVLPLSYNHDHRKVYGGTYVFPIIEDDNLPLLLQKQLHAVHALESYTPYMRSLHQMAYVDPLTDLGNKRARDEYLESVNEGSILAIDINRFKQVNESFGHEHGNSVLAELGVIIDRYFMRTEDRGFRWGGEEFTVILPNTPIKHARKIGLEFYKEVAKYQFSTEYMDVTNNQCYIYKPNNVTVSVGAAEITKNCLQIADASLYAAKAVQRMREAKGIIPLSPQLEFPVK